MCFCLCFFFVSMSSVFCWSTFSISTGVLTNRFFARIYTQPFIFHIHINTQQSENPDFSVDCLDFIIFNYYGLSQSNVNRPDALHLLPLSLSLSMNASNLKEISRKIVRLQVNSSKSQFIHVCWRRFQIHSNERMREKNLW